MHNTVEAEDFIAAQEVYSQYAYEALLVENGVTIPEMEDALLSFIDVGAKLAHQEIETLLAEGGISGARIPVIFDKLVAMSFLGVEVATDDFTYPEVGSDAKLAKARAAKLQPHEASRRYRIHPAFHQFLGIQRD